MCSKGGSEGTSQHAEPCVYVQVSLLFFVFPCCFGLQRSFCLYSGTQCNMCYELCLLQA